MPIATDWFIDYNNKLIVHASVEIPYDAQTATFNVGATLTGGTSSATALIVADTDSGATGTLHVAYVTGTFADNETITDNGIVPGSATSDILNGVTTKTATYTSRALYSFLQDTFDELGQMDDTVPMSAQTPTEFTLINGWFIDDESTKFLTGGAITTSGYTDEIRILTLSSGGYTSALNSDIGKTVTGGTTGDTGKLLHFNNTTRKWWVRSDVAGAGGDEFDNGTEAITIASGTGAGTMSAVSVTGEDLYANIYTLGTIATDPNPVTYVFQNSAAISEWWGRGDAQAHIDVVIKVQEADSAIGDGSVTVFTRHFGDLYDHFNITLTTGGRNAVPLATATDLNNIDSGEITIAYESQAGGNFTLNNFVRDTTTGAYGEILADDDQGTTGTLKIGNIVIGTGGSGDFTATNTIQETTNGLATGDTAVSATISAAGVSAVVRGYNNIKIYFVNATLPYNSGSTAPTVGETITGATSGATAIVLSYTLTSGTFGGGDAAGVLTLANWDSTAFQAEDLNGSTSGANFASATAAQTIVASTTKAFEQGTAYPYNVIVDCAGRTMAQVYEWFKYVTRENANSTQPNYVVMYRVNDAATAVVEEDGEEYISAQTTYTPVKASPFGTLAGGKLFGARGVWVENMATADRQNFQLIDSNGTTRTPPNFITITVNSVVSGDKVTVFRTSSGSTINKSYFTSGAGNTSGGSSFTVTGSIPSDTPNTGYIRVVDVSDTSVNRERRYAYSSWTGSVFTLSGATTLDRAYVDATDTAYVPYYDEVSANTSVSVTVIYNAEQTVLTRVRRYNGAGDSILPFQITGTVGSTGYTVAAIRTSDTIVT